MTRLVTALWRGDEPLWKTFWEYGLLYGFFVNAIAGFAALMLFSMDESLLGLVVHFSPAPYNLFALVSVWRAAGKYPGRREWANAARVAAAVIFPVATLA